MAWIRSALLAVKSLMMVERAGDGLAATTFLIKDLRADGS